MDFVLSCLGCVLIGIILSAPMGPVGMLCVQQTLNKGRAAGMRVGLGAALSDWFYCWVVVLSMTLIIGFIERHTAAFALVGGVLLAAFSAMMMRSRPAEASARGARGPGRPGRLRRGAAALKRVVPAAWRSHPIRLGVVAAAYEVAPRGRARSFAGLRKTVLAQSNRLPTV